MQYANILLALAGDGGNTVPKYNISAAEVAVLQAIHGEAAVTEIEPKGERPTGNRAELHRLRTMYGHAKDANDASIVDTLFPGAAARVFETFDELEIDDSFYKPGFAPAAKKRHPLDHDGDGRKGGAVPPQPAAAEPALEDMTKAQLVAIANDIGATYEPNAKKADIITAIRASEALKQAEIDAGADEPDEDGVEDMPDGEGENLFK